MTGTLKHQVCKGGHEMEMVDRAGAGKIKLLILASALRVVDHRL